MMQQTASSPLKKQTIDVAPAGSRYLPTVYFETLLVFLLAATVRLTSLNVFRAVDEEDRWEWAVDFYQALLAGNLPATLVGDGYPGIFPVWLETLWLFTGSIYRSVLQGEWLGEGGVYLLIHEWSRSEYLGVQRFPVALANTLLVVIIFLYTRKLFGRWVGLLAAVLISLDPFYLSDSRVNRAEGLLTGLMFISLLALIASLRENKKAPPFVHLLLSAMFGGLAWLTKSQALVLIPMFGTISLIWHWRNSRNWIKTWVLTITLWGAGAAATFVLLWPATWSVPGQTFSLIFGYLTHKVGAEGVKIFFLGQTILDEDPGLLFYPIIFMLRATPVMLVGLLLGLWQIIKHLQQTLYSTRLKETAGFSLKNMAAALLDNTGIWALLAYVLLYVGGMSLGSHKQDRFLMAAFPAMNTLAAIAFVHLAARRSWSRQKMWAGGAAILAAQLITALPFHPYYFSYFNPLVGGGPVAARLTRIGWGEGMDQVADYLQSQKNPEEMLVATRFWRYLLSYKGQKVTLDSHGEWVRADKVIFYIQQSQRMLDPSPGVIRYFEQHVPPEKVITIDRIDYATIYPNPVHYPANPLVDRIEDEMSLLGYRWRENNDSTVTINLVWENLSNHVTPLAVRLWASDILHGNWQNCVPAPGFEPATQTAGEVVESECQLFAGNLSPGLYDLQVGVQQTNSSRQPLDFSAGWSAVDVTENGALRRVAPEISFAQLADTNIPPTATRLEHLYADRVRLPGYQVTPQNAQPGHPITVTLYWQAQRVLDREAHISLQAFLPNNQQIATVNGAPQRPTSSWRPGEIIREEWTLHLPPETATPAQVRLDVSLFLPETVTPLPVTNLNGEDIPGAIGQIRLEPSDSWPVYQGDNPLLFTFDDKVNLTGYDINPIEENQIEVILYWESLAPFSAEEQHTAFVHLLNTDGTLLAQNDVPPANGFFPTSTWQVGDVVQSKHLLTLPTGLTSETYHLLAGLYRAGDGARLPGINSTNQPVPNNAAPIGPITLP